MCKQKHVCISDDDDEDDDDDDDNNNNIDVQKIGLWRVDWTPYSQDRIQDRDT
jgi:hypothetical protein